MRPERYRVTARVDLGFELFIMMPLAPTQDALVSRSCRKVHPRTVMWAYAHGTDAAVHQESFVRSLQLRCLETGLTVLCCDSEQESLCCGLSEEHSRRAVHASRASESNHGDY